VEKEERGDDDESYLDPFVEEGRMTSSSESPTSAPEDPGSDGDLDDIDGQQVRGRSGPLSVAKKFRSTLKHRLFRALERRRVRRRGGTRRVSDCN